MFRSPDEQVRDKVKNLIEDSIKLGHNLDKTKTRLRNEFSRDLSNHDCLFVEDVYTELLKEEWLERTPKQITCDVDPVHLLELITKLDSISTFEDCYNVSKDSLHTVLLRELWKTSKQLKTEEQNLIRLFKWHCFNEVLDKHECIQEEISFFMCLKEEIKLSTDPAQICQDLGLQEFSTSCDENRKLTFQFFLLRLHAENHYLFQESIVKLKQTSRELLNKENFFLLNELHKIVNDYIKQPIVLELRVDGRDVLEVRGKHITTSKVVKEIEKQPRFSHIEEVRFINSGVIHIDTDFDVQLWHGKNIVAVTDTLIVVCDKKVRWDVSGVDGREVSDVGESGGNVCIIVDSIVNSKNFTVESNGGKGRNGKDGKPGIDGKDGDFITGLEFKKMFPPASNWFNSKKNENLFWTKLCVLDRFQFAEKLYYGDLGNRVLENPSKGTFECILSNCIENKKNFYFEVITKTGCKISFSYFVEGFFCRCQSFLLYEGSQGEMGKPGEPGGLGGKGGYAGEIDFQVNQNTHLDVIKMEAVDGQHGEPGNPGAAGKPGKNGIDRAYLDYSLSLNWPKLLIPHENSEKTKLKVEYFNGVSSERVYCAHNKKYAEINCRKPTFSIFHRTNLSAPKETNHQHDVAVRRKKTIDKEHIKSELKQEASTLDLFKCDDFVDQLKSMMEEVMSDEALQIEKKTSELKVARQVSSSDNNWFTLQSNMISRCSVSNHHDCQGEIPPSKVIGLVKSDPCSLENWSKLTRVRLTLTEIQDVWEIAADPNSSVFSINQQFSNDFNVNFCNKYQLAILEHLETECLNQFNIGEFVNDSKLIGLSLGSYENILVTNHDQENSNISIAEKYFIEDSQDSRKDISMLFKKENKNETSIKESLLTFVNEITEDYDNNCRVFSILKKRYNCLTKNRNENLEKTFCFLRDALKRSNNKSIYSNLLDSSVDPEPNKVLQFENEIEKDKILKALYDRYLKEVHWTYDWANLLSGKTERQVALEKQIEHKFHEFLLEHGPFAACFREFLAYYFNTNICIYSTNESKQILLTHNHNPKARASVHILMKEKAFERLVINNDLVRMIKSHQEYGSLCSKILPHVDSFTKKQDFDHFIAVQLFLSNTYKGIDKSKAMTVRIYHLLSEEYNVKAVSDSFQSDNDKELIRCRLDKLKFEHAGCQNILYYMALHMTSEGNHISAIELCFVINLIIQRAINSQTPMPIVCWIIAAYPQTQWLRELALLELEIYFKMPDLRNKWRKHLTCLNNKEVLMLLLEKISADNYKWNLESVDETLYLIDSIPEAHVGLENLDLSEWKFYLKDRYWEHQLKNIGDWTEDKVKSASYYMMSLENSLGMDLCRKILDMVKVRKSEITEHGTDIVMSILEGIRNTEINENLLNKLNESRIDSWKTVLEREGCCSGKDRSVEELADKVHKSNNTSGNILENIGGVVHFLKTSNRIANLLKKYVEHELRKWIEDLWQMFYSKTPPLLSCAVTFVQNLDDEKLKNSMKQLLSQFFQDDNSDNVSKPSKKLQCVLDIGLEPSSILFETIIQAVNIKLGITLRDTQKLTIMMLYKNKKNVLGQVSTGEGKSLIVVVVAIMKVWSGQKVDIITSSSVLAERDAKSYREIYNLFKIDVGHNCSTSIEERKTVYSNNQVVYGELANFQRDFLLDRFYNENILGDRSFETIIVDEVDSMLLDRGNNMLYLSHEIPGLDKLVPVFVFIWKMLNMPSNSDIEAPFDIAALEDRIRFEMLGQIKKGHIRDLDLRLSEKQINETWEHLVKEKIIDEFGYVLKTSIDSRDNQDLFIDAPKPNVRYLLNKIIEREKQLEVPNYLKSFVATHLHEWINSGIKAMSMENGIDYVVDVDRSGNSSDLNPNITIMDRDTGTDLVNSQWDGGLHQFLQLKHGCRLSLISLKAVFISNVTYLKKYNTLYGLTGTLGSIRERELLKDIYKADFVTIPTSKTKAFTEIPPIICLNENNWIQTIFDQVCEITDERSVLIICETVNKVLTLERKFKELLQCNPKYSKRKIHTYKRDYEELKIAHELKPGNIIISTNLAGRGTDIKLSKELIEAKGLHVCLSYLPDNSRIEEQAFGRVARNGEPGSAQLIFVDTSHNSVSKITDLKKQRDINELLRISNIKKYHEDQIEPEEKCFEEFKEVHNVIKKAKHPEAVTSILLQASLDEWAFWLDKNSKTLKEETKICFLENLSKFGEQNIEKLSLQVKDPIQLVKLGLFYLQDKNYTIAISLFDEVIKREPLFSEVAQYYRVCAKIRDKDLEHDYLLNELEFVTEKLKERSKFSLLSAMEIDWLKKRCPTSILQIESFKQQQLNLSQTYEVFLNTINDILGHEIEPVTFCLPTEGIDEHLAEMLYNDLVKKEVIKHKSKANINEMDLVFSKQYGISPEEILVILQNDVALEDSVKGLKNIIVPSRELFWKDLTVAGVLLDEIKLFFIDFKKLNEVDPSIADAIRCSSYFGEKKWDDKNTVWLYDPEDMKDPVDDMNFPTIAKNKLIEVIGKRQLLYFKDKSIIHLNKRATMLQSHRPVTLQSHPPVTLQHFDSIKEDDFKKLGLPNDQARLIIHELKEKGVIVESCHKGRYVLPRNAQDIDNIELSIFKAYSDEVFSLLQYSFAFRLALTKLNNQINNGEKLTLYLPKQIYKCLYRELKDHGLIKKSVVSTRIDTTEALQSLYPHSMKKTHWELLFTHLYDDETCSKIVNDLIESKKLIIKPKTVLQKMPHLLNMGENEELYHINNTKTKCDKTIGLILSRHQKLQKISATQDSIISILDSRKSTIHKVENPTFSLTPLLPLLENQALPTSEYSLFSLNGFDQILVLEEKKYTRAMILTTSCILLAGLAQLAVGTVLEIVTLNPLGLVLIEQGINDLTFGVMCLISGSASWENFLIDKCVSLTLSAVSAYSKITSFFKSKFGKKINVSSAWETGKDMCSTACKKMTTYFKNFFGATKNADKKVMYKFVVKQVVTRTTKACVVGAAYATLEQVVQQQISILENVIASIIWADLDNIVNHHHVSEDLQELCGQLGVEESRIAVHICYSEVITKYKTINNSWSRNVHLLINQLRPIIKKCVTQYEKINSNISKLEFACIAVTSTNKVIEIVKHKKELLNVNGVIHQILDNVSNKIKKQLNKSGQIQKAFHRQATNVTYIDSFTCKSLDILKCEIKNALQEDLHNHLISPIVNFTSDFVSNYSLDKMSKMWSPNFTREEVCEVNKFRNNLFSTLKEGLAVRNIKPCFLDTEYNKGLVRLFNKKRNPSVFVEMLKKNVPVHCSSVELCCSVILKTLRKEAVRVPGLEVVIERNGTQTKYRTVEERINIPTITIVPDGNVTTNLEKNEILLSDIFGNIHKVFCQSYPQYVIQTPEDLERCVINAVETNRVLQQFIEQFQQNSASNSFKRRPTLNNSIEEQTPYQHSIPGGNWVFNTAVDIDLREEVRSNTRDIELHVLKGFYAALDNINKHLYKTQPYLKSSFKLNLKDFLESKYTVAPQKSTSLFHCYPVKYILTVPFKLPNTARLVDFDITMSLKLDVKKSQPHCPHGPHILYEVSPSLSKVHLGNGVKGHVLLNPQCQDSVYTVNDCHVAGEIIMASNQNLFSARKLFLVVGDSMMKHVNKYTSNFYCFTQNYSNIRPSDLKHKIINFLKTYPEAKYIVLYFGNFALKKKISENDYVQEITGLVTEIQSHSNKIKIFMCETLNRKLPAKFRRFKGNAEAVLRENQQQIILMNQCLYQLCNRHQAYVLKTNHCIGPNDLCGDGIHLNTNGYLKMAKCIGDSLCSPLPL